MDAVGFPVLSPLHPPPTARPSGSSKAETSGEQHPCMGNNPTHGKSEGPRYEVVVCLLACRLHQHEQGAIIHLLLFPFPRAAGPLTESAMARASLALTRSSAPRILPTAGKSTGLSPPLLFLVTLAFFTALSRITPFSRASLLRFSSRVAAAPAMPFRMDMGILAWLRMLSLAPKACTRMSVVLRAVRPAANARVLEAVPAACWDCQWEAFAPAADRMWDSDMSRCRARSLARKAALSSGWSESVGDFLGSAMACAAERL